MYKYTGIPLTKGDLASDDDFNKNAMSSFKPYIPLGSSITDYLIERFPTKEIDNLTVGIIGMQDGINDEIMKTVMNYIMRNVGKEGFRIQSSKWVSYSSSTGLGKVLDKIFIQGPNLLHVKGDITTDSRTARYSQERDIIHQSDIVFVLIPSGVENKPYYNLQIYNAFIMALLSGMYNEFKSGRKVSIFPISTVEVDVGDREGKYYNNKEFPTSVSEVDYVKLGKELALTDPYSILTIQNAVKYIIRRGGILNFDQIIKKIKVILSLASVPEYVITDPTTVTMVVGFNDMRKLRTTDLNNVDKYMEVYGYDLNEANFFMGYVIQKFFPNINYEKLGREVRKLWKSNPGYFQKYSNRGSYDYRDLKYLTIQDVGEFVREKGGNIMGFKIMTKVRETYDRLNTNKLDENYPIIKKGGAIGANMNLTYSVGKSGTNPSIADLKRIYGYTDNEANLVKGYLLESSGK